MNRLQQYGRKQIKLWRTVTKKTQFEYLAVLKIDCCCCSVAQSCLTLCDPMDCSTPGFLVLHYLQEVCSNSCSLNQWCYLIISSSATLFSFCLLSFPASGSFPMSSLHQVAKALSFSFTISPSNEYSGLISFRINWFDLVAVPGTLKSLQEPPIFFLLTISELITYFVPLSLLWWLRW